MATPKDLPKEAFVIDDRSITRPPYGTFRMEQAVTTVRRAQKSKRKRERDVAKVR